jgi:hypothetical protein
MFGKKVLTPKPVEIYNVGSSGKLISILLFFALQAFLEERI